MRKQLNNLLLALGELTKALTQAQQQPKKSPTSHKHRMAVHALAQPASKRGMPIEVEGKTYASLAEASRELGVSRWYINRIGKVAK